jgi:F-type H+-transporting ATPase subunit delta
MAAIEQRYARALADLAFSSRADTEKLRADLLAVSQTLAASRPLRMVLASPAVAWEKKRAILDALAAKLGLAPLTRNFLLVAGERGRAGHIQGMEQAFEQILLDRAGVVRATVTSARELSAQQQNEIASVLERRLGRKLQTRYATDPELVGGFIAQVGDQVYDGSLRGRLERLRQALIRA